MKKFLIGKAALLAAIGLTPLLMPSTTNAHTSWFGGDNRFWATYEQTNGNPYYNYMIDFEARGTLHDFVFDDTVTHHIKSSSGIYWMELAPSSVHMGSFTATDLNMWHRLTIEWCFVGCSDIKKTYWIPAELCGNGGAR